MENLKKKRSEVTGDGRLSGKKIRSKNESSNAGVTVEDAELEEFLAILKRLRKGLNRFQAKGVGDRAGKSAVVASPVMDSGLWNPGFELDDFNECQVRTGDSSEDAVVGFDLNADPVSESEV